MADAPVTAGGLDPLAVMLEARSVALVGASPRPGSLGARMIAEVAKSPAAPRNDVLAAIAALSEEEKIALFS